MFNFAARKMKKIYNMILHVSGNVTREEDKEISHERHRKLIINLLKKQKK
jgi:hypothetical protein